jgi:hypothetical protein
MDLRRVMDWCWVCDGLELMISDLVSKGLRVWPIGILWIGGGLVVCVETASWFFCFCRWWGFVMDWAWFFLQVWGASSVLMILSFLKQFCNPQIGQKLTLIKNALNGFEEHWKAETRLEQVWKEWLCETAYNWGVEKNKKIGPLDNIFSNLLTLFNFFDTIDFLGFLDNC